MTASIARRGRAGDCFVLLRVPFMILFRYHGYFVKLIYKVPLLTLKRFHERIRAGDVL